MTLAVHVPDPDFRIFLTLLRVTAHIDIFDYQPWSAILPFGNSRQSAQDFRHSFFHMSGHLGIREEDVIEQIPLTLRCMNTQVSQVNTMYSIIQSHRDHRIPNNLPVVSSILKGSPVVLPDAGISVPFIGSWWRNTKMFNLKKVPHHGSVENLIFTNVLGGVCRSRSEGQTEEDFRQEIFELIPATVALRKYSKNIFCKRSAFENCLLTIFSSHPCRRSRVTPPLRYQSKTDSALHPFQMCDQGFLQSQFLLNLFHFHFFYFRIINIFWGKNFCCEN